MPDSGAAIGPSQPVQDADTVRGLVLFNTVLGLPCKRCLSPCDPYSLLRKTKHTESGFGIDFGTTNSSVAFARQGTVSLATFVGAVESFRSILYAESQAAQRSRWFAGPAAIREYLDADAKGRLIQSLKSFLASRSLKSTEVFGRQYRIEELIAIFLRDIRTQAEGFFGQPIRRVVAGRPVRFVGAETDDDDAFALARLRESYLLAGFETIDFEMEPVAAAWFHASQLRQEELLLVGDFGGGTSDFSLLRVGPGKRELLGNAGVGLAGDAFDSRLIRHVVSPALGLGTWLRSGEKRLPVPVWLYSHLERWHYLSFLQSNKTLHLLRSLPGQAEEPEKLEALYNLVNDDLGYRLHESVQHTKRLLSSQAEADFHFRDGNVDIRATVRRAEFNAWIAPDLEAIEGAVNSLLAQTGIAPASIDRVFLTGGTSFVPAVREVFVQRFGADRIQSGDEFTSIAQGLALQAERA